VGGVRGQLGLWVVLRVNWDSGGELGVNWDSGWIWGSTGTVDGFRGLIVFQIDLYDL
jgi:hypothetical protein